jgi:hypothetical protein
MIGCERKYLSLDKLELCMSRLKLCRTPGYQNTKDTRLTPMLTVLVCVLCLLALQEDSDTLNKVQERFDVDIKPLPAAIDTSTYMNQS